MERHEYESVQQRNGSMSQLHSPTLPSSNPLIRCTPSRPTIHSKRKRQRQGFLETGPENSGKSLNFCLEQGRERRSGVATRLTPSRGSQKARDTERLTGPATRTACRLNMQHAIANPTA